MNKHFEIAVIGGGIYGCTISYWLSRLNIRNVLIEKGAIGVAGATSFSGGIVRVYDPDPLLAEASYWGRSEFQQWEKYGYPGPSPYFKTGCLYRVLEKNISSALKLIENLQCENYKIILKDFKSLSQFFPWIRSVKGAYGIWELDSGYGDPKIAVKNLAEGSRSFGGTIIENTCVAGLEKSSLGWSVRLPFTTIIADVIIITAGADSKKFLPELPFFTRSISLLGLAAARNVSISHPVIDEVHETYLRPIPGGGLFCGSQIYQTAQFPEELNKGSDSEGKDAISRIRRLVKAVHLGKPIDMIKSYDCYTDNKRPLIGFVSNYDNLYITSGFSGRGFKYSLIVGKGIAFQLGFHLNRIPNVIEGERAMEVVNKFSCTNL